VLRKLNGLASKRGLARPGAAAQRKTRVYFMLLEEEFASV